MRQAKSYSIIDHKFFHAGFFEKLSHHALVLYLFFVVVGDKNGRSFYGNASIRRITKLSTLEFTEARKELIRENLVKHETPYTWIKNIETEKIDAKIISPKDFEISRLVPPEIARREIQKIISKLSNRGQ